MTVRQKLTIIDVIGTVFIVLGISMTVLNFLAARRSITAVDPVTNRKSGPLVHESKVPVTEIAPHGAVNNP
ncbi:MAG: hypothetical protein ACREDD_09025 [Methylocella sp.]